jgi:ribosomal protein L7Ae-like RNA K-turn-binding protein
MNRTKVRGVIGLARRAGKLLLGEETVLDAVRNGTVRYVLLASDAGPNTTKRVKDKTAFRGIPLSSVLPGAEIADAAGRRVLKVCGFSDKGFADLLAKALDEPEQS